MDKRYWNLNLGQIIPGWNPSPPERNRYLLGVLPGEGIGPEIIDASLRVLKAAAERLSVQVDIQRGGKIGLEAQREEGHFLTPGVIEFCESIFDQGGALLCGPGGGRFVYDLRARFDLFCKVSPVRPLTSLLDAGAVKPEARKGVDIFLVRENSGGDYFGRWRQEESQGKKIASHQVAYREEEVERIVRVALALARNRRGRLTLVLKFHGLPSISGLWTSVTEKLIKDSGVRLEILEVDNAAFQLIQGARDFDVVVSSNLFGDILADCAGLLLGSRGLCFSGNFGTDGKAVYQTGHGAAYDLRGRDQANPVGQILSLALLLEVSFGLGGMATLILSGLEKALGSGWRTADIAKANHHVVGTQEFSQKLIDILEDPLLEQGPNVR